MSLLGSLSLAALVLAVLLFGVALWSRSAAWREAGLGFVLAAVAFVAVDRPATSRAWVLAAAPAVVLVAEAARVAVDARRRSGACHVEAAVWRGAAVAAAAGAAVAVLAALAVLILVPSGTVPGGLLPAALALAVAAVLAVAGGLHRLVRRRAAVRRPGPALAVMVAVLVGAAALGAAGAEARSAILRGTFGGPSATPVSAAPDRAAAETATTVAAAPADGISLDTGRVSWWVGLAVIVAGIVAIVRFGQRQQLVPPEDLVPDPVSRDRLDAVGALIEPSATIDRAATLAAVDEALVQLRADAEPRTAVRLAYATVAQGLGRGELVRSATETEGEYLGRALDLLGAGGADLAALTELFARARFSAEPVDEPMRAAALAALERIRVAVADRSTVPGRAGRTD